MPHKNFGTCMPLIYIMNHKVFRKKNIWVPVVKNKLVVRFFANVMYSQSPTRRLKHFANLFPKQLQAFFSIDCIPTKVFISLNDNVILYIEVKTRHFRPLFTASYLTAQTKTTERDWHWTKISAIFGFTF